VLFTDRWTDVLSSALQPHWEGTMAEQLLSVPACQLQVSDEQFRAIGHVALQWAYLEGEIDWEIDWLNKRNAEPVKLGAKFECRAIGWQPSPTRVILNSSRASQPLAKGRWRESRIA
jgi:hypothetical protein